MRTLVAQIQTAGREVGCKLESVFDGGERERAYKFAHRHGLYAVDNLLHGFFKPRNRIVEFIDERHYRLFV